MRALLLVAAGLAVLPAAWATSAQGPADEPAPALKMAALLPPAQRSGPHFSVQDAVQTPGYFHEFTVTSDFGTMQAIGLSQVPVRIQEIAALAALGEVSKSKVFIDAAGQSLVNVGKGVVNVVAEPTETAKGVGSGVKRFGVNLGRRAKRTAESVTADEKKAEGEAEDKGGATDVAAGAAKSLLGVNGAMRKWAQKVGADPYTTNPQLRKALDAVAQVDVAGGLATKIVVPVPGVVSTTASVGGLVWGKDPEELRKLNESRVRALKVGEDGAKVFFRNKAFTLTWQTRLIAALHAVGAPGCGDYVVSAAEAQHEREALFFVESAEMLQKLHETTKVASVLTDSRTLVAKFPSGEAVALLPVDWVRQTTTATAALREMGGRAKAELGATSLRITVTGQVTARAERELKALGWIR